MGRLVGREASIIRRAIVYPVDRRRHAYAIR